MLMTENLEMKIAHFLEVTTKPFSVADIIKMEKLPSTTEIRDQLFSLLTSRRLAFYDDKANKFLSRAGTFAQAVFSIAPTSQEICDGILYIGHRCMPFLNPDLYPHQIHFLFDSHIVDTKIISVPSETVYPYYYLFGEEFVPHLLALDNSKNNEAYLESDFEDPPEISVTVLNMAQIYWDLHMKPGDRFAVRVVSWQQGIVELTHIHAEKVSSKSVAQWKNALHQAFLNMFKEIGPGSSMEEQVLFSFYARLQTLLPAVNCSLEEFMQDTKEIDIVPFGVESRFWQTGKNISITGEWNLLPPTTPRSDIEDLFWRFGYSLPEYVVEAYIRDCLFQRNLSAGNLVSRLLADTELPDYVMRLIFFRLKDICNRIKDGYNWFADQGRGPLRSRFVTLHSAIGAFVHRLDSEKIEIDDLPQTPFIVLSQLMFHVTAILDTFDLVNEFSEFDSDSLYMSLSGMEDTFFEVKTQIHDSFEITKKNRFFVVNADGVQRKGVFLRLEFTTGKNAPVSIREIVVPAHWSLMQLYPVICAAVGIAPQKGFSFTDDDEEYLSTDMTLELFMCTGVSNNLIYLYEDKFFSEISVTIKQPYTGNSILPFCEYTFGRNAVRMTFSALDDNGDSASEHIFAFPGTKEASDRTEHAGRAVMNSADAEIPSVEEVTAVIQRIIRTNDVNK